jgi:hypothetical protein
MWWSSFYKGQQLIGHRSGGRRRAEEAAVRDGQEAAGDGWEATSAEEACGPAVAVLEQGSPTLRDQNRYACEVAHLFPIPRNRFERAKPCTPQNIYSPNSKRAKPPNRVPPSRITHQIEAFRTAFALTSPA